MYKDTKLPRTIECFIANKERAIKGIYKLCTLSFENTEVYLRFFSIVCSNRLLEITVT